MIATPGLFISLHTPVAHDDPATFIFRGNELLLSESGWALPDSDACSAMVLPTQTFEPLGTFDGRYCRTLAVTADMPAPGGFHFVRLRAVLSEAPQGILSIAGRAFQVAEWARTHQFCGVCATRMQPVPGERCLKCPSCAATNYPRISPAMMVLITRGDEALLARNVASTNNMFSALAGFVEAGESIEETVHREVMEEVGLRVHKLQYFGSQPWPFPNSLMIAFKAEYLDGDIRLDETEISEARWFSRTDPLPEVPSKISISGHLLRSHFTQLA